MITVYALVDPRQPTLIRYVGQTSAKFSRHLQHCSESGVSVKCQWVERLRDDGVMPQMIVLEEVEEQNGDKREGHWITHYTMLGFPLTNKTVPVFAPTQDLHGQLDEQKKQATLKALVDNNFNMTAAAKQLGVSRPTLYDMVNKYGIQFPV